MALNLACSLFASMLALRICNVETLLYIPLDVCRVILRLGFVVGSGLHAGRSRLPPLRRTHTGRNVLCPTQETDVRILRCWVLQLIHTHEKWEVGRVKWLRVFRCHDSCFSPLLDQTETKPPRPLKSETHHSHHQDAVPGCQPGQLAFPPLHRRRYSALPVEPSWT